MNEVEKTYETIFGEFASNCSLCTKLIDCEIFNNTHNCNKFECDYKRWFTAEKQLELIKWLMNNPKDFFSWTIQQQGKDIKYAFYVGYEYGGSEFLEFTEALADILNDLWQDLTDAEHKQIKEILE